MIRFIGDVHGAVDWYLECGIQGAEASIQLGDFGLGFTGRTFSTDDKGNEIWRSDGIVDTPLSAIPTMPTHKFICGNHDDAHFAALHPNCLGDYGYLEKMDIFFIRGAFSIDRKWRTPHIDWWPWEELDSVALHDMTKLFLECKPRIVVSHTCPISAHIIMFSAIREKMGSKTQQAMEAAFVGWKPEKWYFGHYHETKTRKIDNTTFTCVGSGQYVDDTSIDWK